MQAKFDDDSQEFAIRVKIQGRVWYGTTKTRLEVSNKADTSYRKTFDMMQRAHYPYDVAHVPNNILHRIRR